MWEISARLSLRQLLDDSVIGLTSLEKYGNQDKEDGRKKVFITECAGERIGVHLST